MKKFQMSNHQQNQVPLTLDQRCSIEKVLAVSNESEDYYNIYNIDNVVKKISDFRPFFYFSFFNRKKVHMNKNKGL